MTAPAPPLSVLVVDAYPDAADSMAEVLRLYGHRVAVARTAAEALAAAGREPPDVALLDLRLPDLDGWQVARWLREQVRAGRPAGRPLLVAVTGCGQHEDRRRSAAAGIDLHLLKPVDPGVLAGLLARFGRTIAPPADGDDDGRPTGALAPGDASTPRQ